MGIFDYFTAERKLERSRAKLRKSLQPVTLDGLVEGNRIRFPGALSRELANHLSYETDGERRQRYFLNETEKLVKKYGLEPSFSAEGGFSLGGYKDLRFLCGRVSSSGPKYEQHKIAIGLYFSRVSPESEEGKKLTDFALEYVNMRIDGYKHQRWKEGSSSDANVLTLVDVLGVSPAAD